MATAPTILTVSQILECATLAGGYAILDREKVNIFNGGYTAPLLPEKIHFVRKRVQYRYDINPTDSTLRDTANLLWSLLGKYGLRALSSLDAGGTVIQITQNGNIIKAGSLKIQLVIGDSASVMPATANSFSAGQSVYVIPWPIVEDSETIFWQGVPVDRYYENDGDFWYRIAYGKTSTTIVFKEGLDYGNLKINALQNLSTSGGSNGGLQVKEITVETTGNTIDVPDIDGFEFFQATTNSQSYDKSIVIQTGTTLDFSAVGGVIAGQKILIFYE